MHAHSTPRNADDKCLKINPCFTEGDSGRYSYQAETTPSTINNDSYQSETIPSTINNDSDNNRDTEISEYVDNFLKRTSSFRKSQSRSKESLSPILEEPLEVTQAQAAILNVSSQRVEYKEGSLWDCNFWEADFSEQQNSKSLQETEPPFTEIPLTDLIKTSNNGEDVFGKIFDSPIINDQVAKDQIFSSTANSAGTNPFWSTFKKKTRPPPPPVPKDKPLLPNNREESNLSLPVNNQPDERSLKIPNFDPHAGIHKENRMKGTKYTELEYDADAERSLTDRSRFLNLTENTARSRNPRSTTVAVDEFPLPADDSRRQPPNNGDHRTPSNQGVLPPNQGAGGNNSQNTGITRLSSGFLKIGKLKLAFILLVLLVLLAFGAGLIFSLNGINARLSDMEKSINKTDQLWLERELSRIQQNEDRFSTNDASTNYEPQSTISALTRDQKLSTKKPFQTTTYKSVRITTTTLKKALQKKPNQKSTSKRPRKGKGFNTASPALITTVLIPESVFEEVTGTLYGYNPNVDFADVSEAELQDVDVVDTEDEEEDNFNPNID